MAKKYSMEEVVDFFAKRKLPLPGCPLNKVGDLIHFLSGLANVTVSEARIKYIARLLCYINKLAVVKRDGKKGTIIGIYIERGSTTVTREDIHSNTRKVSYYTKRTVEIFTWRWMVRIDVGSKYKESYSLDQISIIKPKTSKSKPFYNNTSE